ncbi:MAG: ThiF family adenylyltransferase [Xanthobacteraceae bacterium]
MTLHPWSAGWGEEIGIEDLASPTAVAFVEYVDRFAKHLVMWKGARRRNDGLELVCFDLATDVPQAPHVPIEKQEPVGIIFRLEGSVPSVLALREDFPDTEHQQWVPEDVPCALCIDDRPWVEARATWTAAELLERITLWFHRAARGELHGAHQPLDPFFGVSQYNFVFPRSVLEDATSAELAFFSSAADPTNFVAVPLDRWGQSNPNNALRFTTVAYRVAAEKMTRLRKAPPTLLSLVRELAKRDVDLVTDLRSRMNGWYGAKQSDAARLASLVAIIIEFPIMTPAGEPTGVADTRAFIPARTLGELGVAIGSFFVAPPSQGSQSGYAPNISPPAVDEAGLKAIALEMATVHIEFDQARAAELAGLPESDKRKVVLVGAGAIGSQTSMILAREGRFQWTVVDNDRLLPHNLARHSSHFGHLGQPKAPVLAAQINYLRPPSTHPASKSIVCDVLSPGEHQSELDEALGSADIIIDATASVAAARFLSDGAAAARRASTFFNPAGEAVVTLVEPADRSLTLRDLEAQYYRAVLRRADLEKHLSATGERFAYTGACRALTNRIPQSKAALLSSLAAAALAQMLNTPEGAAGIWTIGADGAVAAARPEVAPITRTQLRDWSVTIDEGLKEEILAIRAKSLPAETGGVLLGVVDAAARSIHIVDALTAPPDSIEEEQGFERGVSGLEHAIRAAMVRTMDQVRYVGEWHSHPRRISTSPSVIDLTQIVWLASVLAMENRPAVMLIAGDSGINILSGKTVE